MRLVTALALLFGFSFQALGAPDLSTFQKQCESIGFKQKTEKYADCVIELYARSEANSHSRASSSLDQEASQCEKMGFKFGTESFATCRFQLKQLGLQQQQFISQQKLYEQQMHAIQKQREYDQAEALFGIANQALGVAGGRGFGGVGATASRPPPLPPSAPIRIVPPSGQVFTCGYQGASLLCR